MNVTRAGLGSGLQRDTCQFTSVQSLSRDSLRPHELQHVRPPCPPPTPGVHPNSCPLSRWCHPTISSSVVPFSSCLQSFPASGSFLTKSVLRIRWPKHWSFSFSVSPCYSQCWFPLWLTGLIYLLSNGLSRIFSSITVWRHQFFGTQPCLWSSSHHIHTWLLEKNISWTRWTFVGKVMSLLFHTLSRFVIAFLPRSMYLLISCLQSNRTSQTQHV